MSDTTSPPAAASAAMSPRASAHPVPGRRLPAALFGARLAARTAPRGTRTIDSIPRTGSPESIAPSKRSLLVTYRRDGRPVATPVWAAPGDDGRFYLRSERTSGKVKRLRRDPRMLVAPCTVRGEPLGAPFEARARVLEAHEEQIAEDALRRRYGLGRELFERAMDILRVDMCYLEIEPDAWSESGDTARL